MATAWSPVQTIISPGDPGGIAADGKTLHAVAWAPALDDVMYTRSSDEGWTWTAAVKIADGAPSPERNICVEGPSVHVFYDRANVLYHRRSLDGGETWSAETTIHTGTAGRYFRYGCAVAGGRVHVVFCENDNTTFEGFYLKYRRSLDNGATWETTVDPYASVVNPQRPDVTAVGTAVHITWGDLRGGGTSLVDHHTYYGRSLDDGATWQTELALTASPEKYVLRSTIAATPATVVVAWQQSPNQGAGGAGDLEIYTRRSSDAGATFDPAVRRTNASNESEHAYLGNRGGLFCLVWSDKRSGSYNTYSLLSTDAGETWGSEKLVSSAASSLPASAVSVNYVVMAHGASSALVHTRDPLQEPEAFVFDDFNRADTGPPPGPRWADGSGMGEDAGVGLIVISNACARESDPGGFPRGAAYIPEYTFTDVFVAVTVTASLSGGDCALWARLKEIGAATTDGYQLFVDGFPATPAWTIARQTNGAFDTGLGASVDQAVAVGDRIGFRLVGSELQAWHHASGAWRILFVRTDSTYSSGFVGLTIAGSTQAQRLDDFSAFAVALTSLVRERVPMPMLRVPDQDAIMRIQGRALGA